MTQHQEKISENKTQVTATNLSGSASAVQLKDNREHSVVQQKLSEKTTNRESSCTPIQRKSNNTGLPDTLKSGIENLSGHAMDDVKVHYNSDKPAQLNAHAYAQGTDIHIASGQEKHLPHEAWHVVQQKQGRVKPTMQMKGKVNINDDKALENEADVMGAKAKSFTVQKKSINNKICYQFKSKERLALLIPNVIQNKNIFQLGKREKRKKQNEIKKEIQGRRQRFKKQFLASMTPKILKLELQGKYEGDSLALSNIENGWEDAINSSSSAVLRQHFKTQFIASTEPKVLQLELQAKYQNDSLALSNIENAWKDALKNFYPVVGLTVIIADPILKQSFEETLKSIKFQKLVQDVLLEQKKITINLHPTDTKWLTNKKTIIVKEHKNATKNSYLRSLIFEMSNAYHTEEFNDHNNKIRQIVRSKNNPGRKKDLRFGLSPREMADAMEETEWKSAVIAKSIGQEGIENHSWDKKMETYYSINKKTHMDTQKKSGHWERYVKETQKIQDPIRKRIESTHTPQGLRTRFNNDTKLKAKCGAGNVSDAVELAIVRNHFSDKAVMDILKERLGHLFL